jgi:hypothetical protein
LAKVYVGSEGDCKASESGVGQGHTEAQYYYAVLEFIGCAVQNGARSEAEIKVLAQINGIAISSFGILGCIMLVSLTISTYARMRITMKIPTNICDFHSKLNR